MVERLQLGCQAPIDQLTLARKVWCANGAHDNQAMGRPLVLIAPVEVLSRISLVLWSALRPRHSPLPSPPFYTTFSGYCDTPQRFHTLAGPGRCVGWCSTVCSDADRGDRRALAGGRGVGGVGARVGEPLAARHSSGHREEDRLHRVSGFWLLDHVCVLMMFLMSTSTCCSTCFETGG